MNGKANKQQIQFPLKYNFKDDRIQIDNTFSTVDELNSPTLNDMIQPVYTQDLAMRATYDKWGNKYFLRDGKLYKNDKIINNNIYISPESLTKTEVTDEVKDFVAFDIYGGTYHGLKRSGNTYSIVKNNSTIASFTSTNPLIESRCRFIGSRLVTVMYFGTTSTYDRLIVYIDGTSYWDGDAKWTVCRGRLLNSETVQLATGQKGNIPVIHICNYLNGKIGISLTKSTGTMLKGTIEDCSFITLVEVDATGYYGHGLFQFGNGSISSKFDIREARLSGITTQQSTETSNIFVSTSQSTSSSVLTLVEWNNEFYYYSAGITDITALTKAPINPSDVSTSDLKYYGTMPNGAEVWQITQYRIQFKITYYGSTNYSYSVRPAYIKVAYPNKEGGEWQKPTMSSNIKLTSFYYYSDEGVEFEVTTDKPTRLNSGTITFYYNYYGKQPNPKITCDAVTIGIHNAGSDALISSAMLTDTQINSPSTVTVSTTAVTVTSSQINGTIFLDDGYLYDLRYYTFNSFHSDNTLSYWESTFYPFYIRVAVSSVDLYALPTGMVVGYKLNTTVASPITTLSECYHYRGISYVINQDFFQVLLKTNNGSALDPVSLNKSGNIEQTAARFLEAEYSNTTNRWRYNPGTSRLGTFNYYSQAFFGDPTLGGNVEDNLTFVVGGYRANLSEAPNYGLLYNVDLAGTAYLNGISWHNGTYEGILLTPWVSVDESTYVITEGSSIVYKDVGGRWWKIGTTTSQYQLKTALEGELIVINTTDGPTAYDPKLNVFSIYASDYNGRLRHGSYSYNYFNGAIKTSATTWAAQSYIRYTANGMNPIYYNMPRYKTLSRIDPIIARYRCRVGEEVVENCDLREWMPYGVSVFYSTIASTSCKYRYDLRNGSYVVNHSLAELLYPGSTSSTASLIPSLFATFLDGAGNNDLVIEGYDAYVLTYYDNEPYLVYSSATKTSNVYGDGDSFFCLQGQFYGIIGDKLYALVYSNGAIAQMDCIIDLGSIKFLGNNPMISFWWDKVNRVVKSFTGDANLSTLYSASKFKDMSSNGHWYDKTIQSIFVDTDKGLLVFADKSTYLMPQFKNVTNIEFSEDGVTHITSNDVTYNLKYYEDDGYVIAPTKLETEFYGLGANEYTNIDRWDISLYDNTHSKRKSYLKAGVKSLTDVSAESEEKRFEITPEMFDKNTDYVLIRYVPKLQKGQGIKLLLETDLSIQKIVPHISDMGTGTLTKRGL